MAAGIKYVIVPDSIMLYIDYMYIKVDDFDMKYNDGSQVAVKNSNGHYATLGVLSQF